jgi:hypothetical protein
MTNKPIKIAGKLKQFGKWVKIKISLNSVLNSENACNHSAQEICLPKFLVRYGSLPMSMISNGFEELFLTLM